MRTLWSQGDFGALARKAVEKLRRRPLPLPAGLAAAPRPQQPPVERAPRDRPLVWMIGSSLERDGAPLSQSELAGGLSASGFRVEVQSPRDGPLRGRYLSNGIQLRIRPELVCSPTVPEWYEADVRRLARLFRRESPDLIFVSTIDGFAAVDAAAIAGIPAIWNIRESEPWRERLADRHPAIAARALAGLSYCDALAFVAESSRDVWGHFTVPSRSHVIHNAAHPSVVHRAGPGIAEIRSSLGVGPDETLIVSVGTLCPRKGQLDVAQALSQMPPETLARMVFAFVGRSTPGYGQKVEAAVRAAPAARVRFLGEVDDGARYAAAADVLVNTSRSEAFPRTFIEAAAGGTAIIASCVDGASERLQDGRSAAFYQPGDISRLATLMTELTETETRQRLADGAHEALIATWNYDDMTAAYAKLVRDSLRPRVGAPLAG